MDMLKDKEKRIEYIQHRRLCSGQPYTQEV